MQPMSDKELDQLFQQKFGDFQPEASPELWNRINRELGEVSAEKKRRTFPVAWMAAASVAVVVLAGVWLMRNPATAPTKLTKPTAQVAQHTAGNRPQVVAENAGAAPEAVPGTPVQKTPVSERRTIAASRTSGTAAAARLSAPKEAIQEEPVVPPQQATGIATLAAQEPVRVDIGDQSRAVDARTFTPAAKQAAAPVLAVAGAAADETGADQPRAKIRTIGGLVNFVVGKVDKREDKIIEFGDSEEGEIVSGINLGLLKFKTKSHKRHDK